MLFVFILYFLLVMGIGFFFFKYHANSQAFYLGRSTMPTWSLGISIAVTMFSAINYLAFPTEIMQHGAPVLVSLLGFILVIIPVNRWYLPAFWKTGEESLFTFFNKKYGKVLQRVTIFLYAFWRLLWMGTALFAAAKILSPLLGLSILSLILILGIIATLYSCLGGFQAVVWTDVLQFIVLFGGIVFAISWIGWEQISFPDLPRDFFSFDPQIRISFWSASLGASFVFLVRYGADPLVFQRYRAAGSLDRARRVVWINSAVAIFVIALLALLALSLQAWGRGEGRFVILLGQLLQALPQGASGLILAGLAAATMSSLDSGVNTLAHIFQREFYPQKSSILISFIVGVLGIFFALIVYFWMGKTQSLFIIVNKIINAWGAPLCALVTLSFFSSYCRASSLIWGTLLGLLASIFISLGPIHLALHYYVPFNLLISLTLCFFIEWIIRNLDRQKM